MLLVPRQFRITIGGLDHTDCVLSFDGGDDKLSFGSGLIVFRGTMVLGRALGFESLDDRKNKRWNRGTPIVFEIADDTQVFRRSPRGGALFILSSLYDLTERTLSLEVGDSFALLAVREGSDDKTGVCLGASESKTAVINRLLAASGAPALIDQVPGNLSSGAPNLVQGSYIEQAGVIANGSGCFLWVDLMNQTRASEAKVDPSEPLLTIDLSSQAANYKRLPGESPAAWVVINAQNETKTSEEDYGFESTSESIGSIATAGVLFSGQIVVRKEWQKESLSGTRRFVETKVWEPQGAIIPLRSGTANHVLSHNRLEVFEYESSNPTTGTNAADKCQQGNQGRLKKRTLTNYRPLGAVLDRVIQTAPQIWRPTGLELPILALREIEEFDYGSTIAIVTASIPPLDPTIPISSNDVPPEDPQTRKQSTASGLSHKLKRWEPAGAISPEDFEWDAMTPMWIAGASTLTESYELVKEWTEAREDEWIAIERERISFNRNNPEVAAEIRDKIKAQASYIYPKDLFCALQMTRNDRKVSSSGNTQPPAPDTLPSRVKTVSTPKKYKYKTPIDTDFPFLQKTKEYNVEHLSIDGTLLAERWAKIAWGRFKGMSVQSEFRQAWWDYRPFCRIDVLELNITPTNDTIDRSAYIGDGFAIAASNNECVIGFDGIFLGFLNGTILNPPYVTVSFAEPTTIEKAITKITYPVDTTPIVVSVRPTTIEGYVGAVSLNPVKNLRILALSNVIRDSAGTTSSGSAILNPQTGYREAYKMAVYWSRPDPSNHPIAKYEVSIRKNSGAWSLPITTTATEFKIETQLTAIPGISFVSTDTAPYGYVGPGIYEVKVKAIAPNGGWSETTTTQQYPSVASDITINNPNAGYPISINSFVLLSTSITRVSPNIEVKAGFPGYLSQIQWSLTGPGSIASNNDGTANFTASSGAFISGSTVFANQMSVVTASIAGTTLAHTVEIRQTATAQNYAVTGVQLFGFLDPASSNLTSPLQISSTANNTYLIRTSPTTTKLLSLGGSTGGITIGSTIQGTGTFPQDLDLYWSIVSGPGSFYQEFYSPGYTPGERNMFTPGGVGTTVIKASAPNGQFGLYTIENTIANVTGISFSRASGQTYLVNSEFIVDAVVQGTGVFVGDVDWYAADETGVESLASTASITITGNRATVRIVNGTLNGQSITIKARSRANLAIIADFTIIAKTNVLSVVVIPSKTTITPTDTFSAMAYLNGFGEGVGSATIGTLPFTWSVSGPASLINASGVNTTGTANSTAGNITLTATYQTFSGNVLIANTGVLPTFSASPIPSYTISTEDIVQVAGSYGSLNDSLNTTGVALGSSTP
jgi:hypothetical protein